MSEAVLGFKIDSSQATGAAADLDRLTASAARTQAAADKLEAEASGLGAALGKAGDGASKAKPAVDNLGKSFGTQDEHVRAFRMEVERLTMKYQPLANATRQYEATVAEIGRAHKVGAISAQQMTTAIDAERLAFERLKTSATTAGAAVKAANANGRAGGNGNFATSNIAAQFQDIGVTAAMGMSPLQIALQQGTQLSAALGPMGAAGAVKGLGAAFMSIISPVSLVTIGLVAGTAALIQYFMAAEDGTDKTSKLFEEQNDTIRRAAELWGDAAPALKAYVDELDRADKITQGKEAGAILAGRELDGLSENLDGLKRQGIEAFRALQGDANNAVVVRDLRDAWGDLRERLDNGTASMADLNRVQRELSSAVSQYGVPEVLAFRDAFDDVTAAIYRGVEAAQEARTAWIAALAGGTNVQDILSGSTFTEGGKTYSPNNFVPLNAPRPTSRPLDLSGDPDPTKIMNSDGRLVGVPIPGQKPNAFELEKEADAIDDVTKAYRRAQEAQADFWLDLSFQERQATRTSTDQKIATTLTRYGFSENLQSPEANALRQQMRGEEAKGLFKDFFSGAYSEAWSNGGKIGEALGKSALNAAQKATEKAWDAVFDKLATGLSNWLTGSGKTRNTGGVSSLLGATTTLGDLVGANDNKSFSAPVGAVTRAALGPVSGSGDALAWNFWKSKGLEDHQVAGVLGNIKAESAFNPAAIGDGGAARGLYQWNDRSPKMLASVGADWKNNPLAQHEFAYSELMGPESKAWGALKGSKDVRGATGAFAGFERPQGFSWGNPEGAHNFSGRLDGAEQALAKFGGTTEQVTQGVGKLGTGLNAITQNMGAGAGLGKAAGGFDWSSLFSSSWKPNTTLGAFLGANANGTDNWRGGMSMVGERGPELVNLPQGSGVISNHKLMAALSNDNGPRRDAGPRQLNVNVLGANGDAHVMSLVQQGVGEALAQDREADRRGGWGEKNRRFGNQKA